MIYIFCALYEEAKHIIKTEKLKINSTDLGFNIYENSEAKLRLIITGVGEIKAATAVAAVCARYSPTTQDILINFGSAAGGCITNQKNHVNDIDCYEALARDCSEAFSDGTTNYVNLYLINKITEKCTSHTYYPDILIKHPFPEAEIITVPTPISTSEIAEITTPSFTSRITNVTTPKSDSETTEITTPSTDSETTEITTPSTDTETTELTTPSYALKSTKMLFDMEAAGIYQAGIHFFSPNRMYFLKTISDNGDLSELTPDNFSMVMKVASEHLMEFYKDFLAPEKHPQEDFGCHDFKHINLSNLFMCSETMKNMLVNYIRYSKNAGIDYQAIIKNMIETGTLPALSRKMGKKALNNFKEWVLNSAPHISNKRKDENLTSFSHIYVEKNILDLETTKGILSRFPDSRIIIIDNYKDIFCRKNQDVHMQSRSRALILSETKGKNIYKGAPVCQSFGNKYFYYTSCVMNCIYDCEYCYLKGMYPSGHIVINVNIEAIFEEVKSILKRHDAYICISYDTDLLALENLTGFVRSWINFTKDINLDSDYHNLKIEIRTKCGRTDLWDTLPSDKNVIFAFTLSPQTIIDLYEDKTSSEALRINSAKKALEKKFSVRLCIDPIIYHPDWKELYGNLIDNIFKDNIASDVTDISVEGFKMSDTTDISDGAFKMSDITDISVGSFRISQDYLKNMRKSLPDSQLVWFPFENENKVYHYPSALMKEMEEFVVERLSDYIDSDRIFRWDN